MYCSLEKLDLGIAPAGQVIRLLVQTDHRDALAIADDAALSVIFAVTRCLVARAIGEADAKLQPFRVVYQLGAEPPAFLSYTIEAAGAVIARGQDLPVSGEPSPEPRISELVALIDDACAHIARDVRQRKRIEPSIRELAAYERDLAVGSDEHGYYAAIVSLGALAADVVRARAPAAVWGYSSGDVIPFGLAPPGVADEHRLRVFALAKRYVDGLRAGGADVADAPSTLLGLMFGDVSSISV